MDEVAKNESSEDEANEKRQTLVEKGTAFKGSFSSDCPIVVRGRIEGDLSGPSLTVSDTGSVAGTVKVGEIHSEGELSGEFEADVVRLSGAVKDNTVIRAKSLEVQLRPERGMMQVIFGECELDVGDMPSKEQAAEAAEAQVTDEGIEAPASEGALASEGAEAKPEEEGEVKGADEAVAEASSIDDQASSEESEGESAGEEALDASSSEASEDTSGSKRKKKKDRERASSGTLPPPAE